MTTAIPPKSIVGNKVSGLGASQAMCPPSRMAIPRILSIRQSIRFFNMTRAYEKQLPPI
jgi:hypothetical protein